MKRERSGRRQVLVIGPFPPPGVRYAPVAVQLAARLEAAGWSVIRTSAASTGLGRGVDILNTVLVRRQDYDVAHLDVFSGPAFAWALAPTILLRLMGRPVVLTLRGGDLPSFAKRYPLLVRGLLRSAAAVTTPSPYLFECFKHWRPDAVHLPNPLPLESYTFRERTRPRPKLLWLRAYHPIYNPELAVDVLRGLRDRGVDASLTMVGPDREVGRRAKVAARAAALGVEEHLELRDGVLKEEVPAVLDAHDVFINTTNVDNTPVTVLEAWACGLCVVSTNAGGLQYLLKHERDALVVPPGNASAMVDQVQRVLNEPELAGQISRGGRQQAEAVDWQRLWPQWEALLEGALPDQPTGSTTASS